MFVLDQFKIKTVSESDSEGMFEIAPLPRGFGHTLGNTIRRILLSSIPGTAITSVKFSNVQHEYTTLENVQDDVLSIVMRFKSLPLHSQSTEPVTLKLQAKGKKGEATAVTAADLEKNSMVEIVDPTHHITYLTDETELNLEITVERGVGFVRADDDSRTELGMIPLDADYNPVKNVALDVVQTRVGQQTDLDKLNLKIMTTGAVRPSVVLHQAAQVLSELATNLLNTAEEVLSSDAQELIGTKTEVSESSEVSKEPVLINDLGLSNRLTNALVRGGYEDLNELEGMTEEEVANIKGMGAKSLTELTETLEKYGIKLI